MKVHVLPESSALAGSEFVFTHACVIAGHALLEIQQKELFKPYFNSFEEYHIQEWGLNTEAVHGLLSATILFEIKLDGGPSDVGPEAVGEDPDV